MTNPPQSPYGPVDPSAQTPPQQPPYGYTVVGSASSDGPVTPKPGNGPGLAALIIGIVAVITAFVPIVNVFAFVLGPAGIIVGIIGLVLANRPRKQAAWGTGLSAASMLIAVVMILVYTFGFLISIDNAFDDAYDNQATATPSPYATATPFPEESGAGALPLGSVVELVDIDGEADYTATITTSILDATDAVASADPSNTAAPAGYQWAMVTVDVTSLSASGTTPRNNIRIEYVAGDGRRFMSTTPFAIAPDPRFELIDDLAVGESATGNIIVAIATDAVGNGSWVLAHSDTQDDADKFFFETE